MTAAAAPQHPDPIKRPPRQEPAAEEIPPVGHVVYELLSAGIFGTDEDGPFTIRRVEIVARFSTRVEARDWMTAMVDHREDLAPEAK